METQNEEDQDHRTDLAGRRDPGAGRTERSGTKIQMEGALSGNVEYERVSCVIRNVKIGFPGLSRALYPCRFCHLRSESWPRMGLPESAFLGSLRVW